MIHWLRPAAATVFFCLIALPLHAEATSREDQGIYVEQEQRNFPDISLQDEQGATIHLSESAGVVRLVNFWATWCAPCVRELPALVSLQQRYGGKLRVLTVSQDRGGFRTITPFIERHKLESLTHYWDRHALEFRKLRIQGLPTTYLIDSQSRLVATILGEQEWLSDDMAELLREAGLP